MKKQVALNRFKQCVYKILKVISIFESFESDHTWKYQNDRRTGAVKPFILKCD